MLIIVGIVGIVVPVIPGLLVAVLGVLLWAYETGGSTAWTVFGICLAIYIVGVATQFLVPGKRLRQQGVKTSTLLLAVLLGIVGMFVIPIVGFFVGFVLGIFLVEQSRSRDRAQAWARTKHALKAIAMSMGIELCAGLLIAATWVIGVIAT
ncbi:membrane protein [Knoellia sinensis KCTC 19936]|uniref:Membrane protein n=1 Tax=Knoellia sinensis KCTC 19936 TaxID=1385520 RepID=A0A0A0J756_9MICO|nr:membrane protein [Knoellia sinensis KCTC 19936]